MEVVREPFGREAFEFVSVERLGLEVEDWTGGAEEEGVL